MLKSASHENPRLHHLSFVTIRDKRNTFDRNTCLSPYHGGEIAEDVSYRVWFPFKAVNGVSHKCMQMMKTNSPVSQRFSHSGEQRILAHKSLTNCRLYSNISQILLLYDTSGYHNKFDSTKSLGVCYWCVKIPQCRCMEHGSKYITFYVQKHIAHLAMCCDPPLVRDKPLGAPAFVKPVYWPAFSIHEAYVKYVYVYE